MMQNGCITSARVPEAAPKVTSLVQQDQDGGLARTKVIAEPTYASRPEALQVKTTFRQH